ncbi:MAG: hypothetical protein EYC68_15500 [Chloroflexota bacterium]|nr:MAG: hypothetical protein EYC68_15500 [Chloroflexota bacterium]
MNSYPPQLPPPQQPGGYNPFNPYQGYDPSADYVPWLPGRQGPRFIPIAIVAAAILICSCCSFLAGTIFGIELPGMIAPSTSSPPRDQNNQPSSEEPTPEEPTPEEPAPQEGGFHWQVIYPQT